ncbi:hypothetical protein pb186bvf_014105 [Paramecium bursaria]
MNQEETQTLLNDLIQIKNPTFHQKKLILTYQKQIKKFEEDRNKSNAILELNSHINRIQQIMSDARLASSTSERLNLFQEGENNIQQCQQLIIYLDKDEQFMVKKLVQDSRMVLEQYETEKFKSFISYKRETQPFQSNHSKNNEPLIEEKGFFSRLKLSLRQVLGCGCGQDQ